MDKKIVEEDEAAVVVCLRYNCIENIKSLGKKILEKHKYETKL
jgi:hypothetical protein